MKRIAHLAPHAWALDGFADLVSQREPLDVMGEAGVLFAYGVAILALASWRLRRVISPVPRPAAV